MLKTLVKRVMDTRNANTVNTALGVAKEYSDTQLPKIVGEAVKSIADERQLSKLQIFQLFYEINRTLYPEFVINDHDRMMLRDSEFRAFFAKFCSDNWTSFERKWNVREMLRLLPDVPGNLAECGVYTGGTSFLLCQFAEKHGRQVHLFDSYEGLSEPDALDGSHWAKGNLSASEAIVHQNLAQFDCFKTFKGWIPDAFPAVEDQRYAFLHVDVDLGQPTGDSLEFFYPRMNKGGVIILDDHGYDTCPGARKAVLDYMEGKPEPVLDLSTGQGLIIKQ